MSGIAALLAAGITGCGGCTGCAGGKVLCLGAALANTAALGTFKKAPGTAGAGAGGAGTACTGADSLAVCAG